MANPESGTINYVYDNNGNLTRKTDARGIRTDYTYDALNRVTFRDYSDSTPDVTYTYDNLPNAKGKLTKVSSAVSTTEFTSFDILGRVTGHKQTTDGVAYNTGYIYNLSGALTEETYPSGRKVRNTLDAEGDLALVETQTGGGSWQTRAGGFTYTAAGAVGSMQLGNGRWESTQFNSRLQPEQIALGTTQNGTDLLKLNYSYGSADNNGNVQSQTITVPAVGTTPGFIAVQNYTYDALNRLKSATESVGGVQSWKQAFTYDRYGNRNFDLANTTTLGSCPAPVCNPSVSPNNDNRLSSAHGYSYDAAGNNTVDAEGRQFTYDAENKQTLVRDASNVTIGQYSYDGDGRRVKKISNTENITFVYDAAGKLIEEYSGSTVTTSYVYAGSRLLTTETAPETNYLTADRLGSPRIHTNQTGAVTARHDFHPFGDEIFTIGGRIAGMGYVADNVRKQFTGYERDKETDLDFAQARYYSNSLGRFSSPDEFVGGAEELHEFDGKVGHNPTFYSDLADPRSLSKYQYCLNNPVNYIDPDGHQTQISDYLWKAWETIKESAKGLIYPLTDELQEAKNGVPPPDRNVTPLGDFADGNGRNLVKRTWAEMADRAERTFDTVAMIDPTGSSGILKLAVNKAAGRQNSASDYVITLGAAILTRGKGSGQGQAAFTEAKQLLGSWSKGTFNTLSKSIKYHFGRHGAEVGAKDALQYMRKAQAFANNLKGAKRTALDGGKTRYTKGGKYIIKDKNGKIISFGVE